MAALTDIPEGCNGIPRIQARTTSVSDFLENYERPYRPVIIQGVPEEEGWNASAKWQPSELYRNYADAKFKCGEDDDGYAVKIKMKYFLEYMRQQKDDSPLYVPPSQPSVLGGVSHRRRRLCTPHPPATTYCPPPPLHVLPRYIFDSRFENRTLLDDFCVPSYFTDDLFKHVGNKRRPPHRWFLIGPKCSGTCVHIDPLATSAWNTLISGRKRWCVWPPGDYKPLLRGKKHFPKGADDEPLDWFRIALPKVR
jgi:histone arginine demethylase JMJD6